MGHCWPGRVPDDEVLSLVCASTCCTVDLLRPNSPASLRHYRAALCRSLLDASNHTRLHSRRCSARLATVMLSLQPGQTRNLEASLPQRHSWGACAQPTLGVATAQTVGQRRIKRARKTSPAGNVLDCAQRPNSSRCSTVTCSNVRLSATSYRTHDPRCRYHWDIPLVCHRVNHVVHANSHTERRISFRIFRRISPFP